jgi:hypothetical protein
VSSAAVELIQPLAVNHQCSPVEVLIETEDLFIGIGIGQRR